MGYVLHCSPCQIFGLPEKHLTAHKIVPSIFFIENISNEEHILLHIVKGSIQSARTLFLSNIFLQMSTGAARGTSVRLPYIFFFSNNSKDKSLIFWCA